VIQRQANGEPHGSKCDAALSEDSLVYRPLVFRNERNYKRTDREGTEGAEENVINHETLPTLRTQRLCGEIMIASLVAALPGWVSYENELRQRFVTAWRSR
jgi:hypothetical protein